MSRYWDKAIHRGYSSQQRADWRIFGWLKVWGLAYMWNECDGKCNFRCATGKARFCLH